VIRESVRASQIDPDDDYSFKTWLKENFVEDKWFWLAITILFLANIGLYQNLITGEWFGFIMASYSAIANDSIQTLGVFISSNKKTTSWFYMWLWIGGVFLATTGFSFFSYDGDISYERLEADGYNKDPESFNYL
jgi:hypothetical protein